MAHELIYDPKGEAFEVKASLVSDLLLNKGWTRGKPTFEPTAHKSVKRKPKKFARVEPSEDVQDEYTLNLPFDDEGNEL